MAHGTQSESSSCRSRRPHIKCIIGQNTAVGWQDYSISPQAGEEDSPSAPILEANVNIFSGLTRKPAMHIKIAGAFRAIAVVAIASTAAIDASSRSKSQPQEIPNVPLTVYDGSWTGNCGAVSGNPKSSAASCLLQKLKERL